ncbi:MAG: hypothetical protein SF172_13210 [Burkholderiales bacterium]|nr:hypothetical protein [Burkholderiales bacterium]
MSVRLGDRELVNVPAGQLRLQETFESRTLVVRSAEVVVAPYLTLELTVRCDEKSAPLTQTYDLVIPGLQTSAVAMPQTPDAAAATVKSSSITDSNVSTSRSASSGGGIWVTGNADTLDRIARGIYPRSEKMRAEFIRRTRAAHPELNLPADSDRLAPGMKLRLPDLVAMANESPRLEAGEPERSRAGPSVRSPAPGSDTAGPARRTSEQTAQRVTAKKSPARLPEAVGMPASPNEAKAATPKKPASAPASGGGSGFMLRLSGAEMDLSRSKGVSESARAALRDKQMLLDADDQVAALLALRNTVKQLEGRLNEMQLKLSTGTLPAVAPKTAAEPAPPAQKSTPSAAATAVAPPAAAVVTPPQTAKAQPAPSNAATAPLATPSDAPPTVPASSTASATTEAPARPAASAPTPAPPAANAAASPTEPQPDAAFWMSPLFLGIGAALLLLLGWAGWRFAQRGRGLPRTLSETVNESAASAATGRATSDLDGPPSDALPKSEWDDHDAYAPEQSAYRSSPPSDVLRQALREAEHHETVRLSAPPDLIDSGATSLELDTRPATSVDFMLGDEGGEDKSRRQRYMEERFPELAHHSISVDEPDSIIDAARHHYEEGQLQKAIELLTYAFEERPGQLRFWLALFEIHRLEQRVGDFADLAARFKNVHGGTDAWPKVQHIGRELEPGQPLYSAALGRLGVPMDADFDPMSENWLNVPMDFTSDVLMIELRHSLMAEHVVLDDELRRPLIEVPA